MYRKVLLSSFHNGKAEYCMTSGTEDNSTPVFLHRLYVTLFFKFWFDGGHRSGTGSWAKSLFELLSFM